MKFNRKTVKCPRCMCSEPSGTDSKYIPFTIPIHTNSHQIQNHHYVIYNMYTTPKVQAPEQNARNIPFQRQMSTETGKVASTAAPTLSPSLIPTFRLPYCSPLPHPQDTRCPFPWQELHTDPQRPRLSSVSSTRRRWITGWSTEEEEPWKLDSSAPAASESNPQSTLSLSSCAPSPSDRAFRSKYTPMTMSDSWMIELYGTLRRMLKPAETQKVKNNAGAQIFFRVNPFNGTQSKKLSQSL